MLGEKPEVMGEFMSLTLWRYSAFLRSISARLRSCSRMKVESGFFLPTSVFPGTGGLGGVDIVVAVSDGGGGVGVGIDVVTFAIVEMGGVSLITLLLSFDIACRISNTMRMMRGENSKSHSKNQHPYTHAFE